MWQGWFPGAGVRSTSNRRELPSSKLGFIVGVGVGYVLGAKAGRRRYEQIKARADKVWQSPTVQHKVNDATQVVRDKAPELQHKVAAGRQGRRLRRQGEGRRVRPLRHARLRHVGSCRRRRARHHGAVDLTSARGAIGLLRSVGGAGRWCSRLVPVVDNPGATSADVLADLTTRQLLSAWESSPALVTITVGPEHVLVFQNAASRSLFGARELGLPLCRAFPEIRTRHVRGVGAGAARGAAGAPAARPRRRPRPWRRRPAPALRLRPPRSVAARGARAAAW